VKILLSYAATKFINMKTLLIALSVVGLLHSCASSKANKKEWWMGLTRIELMKEHGLPVQSGPDGNGGELILFSKVQMLPGVGSNPTVYNYRKVLYFMDSSGHAYQRNVDVSPIPPEQVNLTIYHPK